MVNPNLSKNRKRVFVPMTGKPSMTQQQFREEVDINTIVERVRRSGVMPPMTKQPYFLAMPSQSFQEMQNFLIDARTTFAALPSRVRDRFNNDPYQLVRFVEDSNNRDEAVKLGLIQPPAEVLTPVPANPAAPAAA